jgi:UDP-glucuronate 4-epimerase
MRQSRILLTGCAGFIGYSLALKLLNKKYFIDGIDNLNSYYDKKLKLARLKILKKKKNFFFSKIDIRNFLKLKNLFFKKKYDVIIHLAAQAGVRYSIKNPRVYLNNNILGFFNMLETARIFKARHFIYASTSSVYGNNKNYPLKERYNTDAPLSFYAATKKSNEVMAHSYSNIYNLPTTGLRFFTVYGPYGRPDMSLYKFTKNILNHKNIDLYNNGNHFRDFTYINDIVDGIEKIIENPSKKKIPYEIFNIGGSDPKSLNFYIQKIEHILKIKSKKNFLPLQRGDVIKTYASIAKMKNFFDYRPKYDLDYGIKKFIKWFKNFYNY